MSGWGMLATAHGLGEAAEKLGVIALAALAALVVLSARGVRLAGGAHREGPAVPARVRALALVAVLVLTPVLLAIDVWHTVQFEHLRAHAAEAAGAGVLALAAVLGLALAIRREPRAFPLLAVAALPFRLPISTGGSTSNLLIPLYLVVGAGCLAHLLADLRGERIPPPGPPADVEGPWPLRPRTLEWLLLGSVALYALQAAYSADFSKALENMVFFYVPFALLFMLLREVHWTRELLLGCLAVAVGLAVLFAGIGFVEYYRKHLFLNPKVVAANQYDNFFRVNSLFFDPNIYGRFLALVMIAVTGGVLWSARRREVLLGGVLLLWLLAGLVTSFSQSSVAGLLLGLAVLAAWRWDVRGTVYVAVALGAVALVIVLAAPPSLHLGLSGRGGSASNATSGRTKLIEGGLRLFADRPLEGFGPGSFASEYRRHEHVEGASATSASHTIPITVAAEQGVPGLILYAALLVAAFAVLFGSHPSAGRAPPGARSSSDRGPGAVSPAAPFRLTLAACFAALVLHTLTYADFLEDPLTWTLLGIGVALAVGARERGSAPAAQTPVSGVGAPPAGPRAGQMAI
jgi:O-antigen ligase